MKELIINHIKKEYPMSLLLKADPSETLVLDYIHKGFVYFAEAIGVYVLLPIDDTVIELKNISVYANQQGQGYGSKLLKHAIHTARNKGYKQLVLGTGNSSVNQLLFYQKNNFRITSIDFDFFTRNYPETIFENGIVCRDMIRLTLELIEPELLNHSI